MLQSRVFSTNEPKDEKPPMFKTALFKKKKPVAQDNEIPTLDKKVSLKSKKWPKKSEADKQNKQKPKEELSEEKQSQNLEKTAGNFFIKKQGATAQQPGPEAKVEVIQTLDDDEEYYSYDDEDEDYDSEDTDEETDSELEADFEFLGDKKNNKMS